jgi:hypothetical protein
MLPARVPTSPDFTHSALEQPQIPAEAIRGHLLKMRFLDISQKLKVLPAAPGYLDLIHQLPQARFSLGCSGAIDIGVAARAGREQPFVSLRAGSSIRYPVSVKPGSLFRFALHMPAMDIARLCQSGGQVAAEVVWISGGRELPLFQKTYGASESGGKAHWHDCVSVTPEEDSDGEIMLRVAAMGGLPAPVTVQWGQPYLIESEAAGMAARSAAEMRDDYEARLASAADETSALRAELGQVRDEAQAARHERDEKTQRLGEVHARILEMEKLLTEMEEKLAAPDPGLAARIRGIFRK